MGILRSPVFEHPTGITMKFQMPLKSFLAAVLLLSMMGSAEITDECSKCHKPAKYFSARRPGWCVKHAPKDQKFDRCACGMFNASAIFRKQVHAKGCDFDDRNLKPGTSCSRRRESSARRLIDRLIRETIRAQQERC